MIQAVFFDFNGVIIDDEPLHLKAYTEALREVGIELTEADYLDSLGMDDVTFVRTAFERAGRELSDEELQRVIASEHAKHRALIEKELPIFPGTVTFIKSLARVWPLGVVSMAVREQIDYALERAGLARYFPVVVSAEDVSACKPNPACYLTALDKLNERRASLHVLPVGRGECLVIEDSPPGIRAGLAAGMLTLGVTNTVADSALREAGAHVVTRSLADWTLDALQHVFDPKWAVPKA